MALIDYSLSEFGICGCTQKALKVHDHRQILLDIEGGNLDFFPGVTLDKVASVSNFKIHAIGADYTMI